MEPKPKPKPKPPRPFYHVRLVSTPSNAAVFKKVGRRRKKIGRTPLTLKIKPGKSMRLMLAHGARGDTWITVEPRGDTNKDLTKTVRLKKKSYGGGIPGSNPGIPGSNPF